MRGDLLTSKYQDSICGGIVVSKFLVWHSVIRPHDWKIQNAFLFILQSYASNLKTVETSRVMSGRLVVTGFLIVSSVTLLPVTGFLNVSSVKGAVFALTS